MKSSDVLSHASTDPLPEIVMLDNLDSFTYNLVDEFRCLGYQLTIYRNTLSADFIFNKLQEKQQSNSAGVILVLSPGPGDPTHAGCLMSLLALCAGQFPILGICLGHQALIQHYGGVIARAPEVVHGKSSNIIHNELGAFNNIASPLPVARYHSLVASEMPPQLTMTAHVSLSLNNEEITLPMAIEHSSDAAIGFQFHPESILTTFGTNLLAQSLRHLSALANQTIYKAHGNAHENN
ncbi:aminodeoxychorismate/anthranilate synthase component II [Colwellia sp. BRX10-3]|uniref:aminodeoxychorismate/anthranilate synthase component II n=1 Tax=Colwellia sp. BRX10-3 TaxID=2759844 RepID=UPI0015F43CD8|nr:aminodeoxychorismate/anthranilate synthase component II [Colwellia sp. BRX10-3]MBA6390734.1 aminodeoxychorismate/anthranilate synthase component II [Colwellia sp. BRX10-3]